MGLSNDLIAQFVKITNDNSKTKTETTLYGTVKEINGVFYVQLDGSDQLTPAATTTDVKAEERVTVMIKNHKAVITGNISSPAARTDEVQEVKAKVTKVETLVADKVSTKTLEAEKARITSLEAKNVTITGKLEAAEANISDLEADNVIINKKLVANTANIEALSTNKLDASVADITYATIKSLEATDAKVNNLEATYGDFKQLTTDNFKAVNADIDNLEANKLSAADAKITYATITDLKAANGNISNLQSDVADIDTLIYGSASGTTIQTSFANAVIAQLGNAQIKSAMIDTVSANKITAGDIITNNVRVLSEDGKLLISDETIQISDNTRVRVQIGKDAANDYSINIWDASGNLMFSKGGITDSAIKEAIIRNDMVSETANIAASKLDIDSLFEEINGSSKTIKSSKVLLDDENQTLDVAFTSLTSDVSGLQNDVSSQGTQISAIQGQITSKVWQSDINEATGTLSDQYSTLNQTVNGLSATVGQHTTQIANKADGSTVTTVSNKVSALETSLSGFQSTVSETYATKNEVDNISVGGCNLARDSKLDKKTDMWSLDYVHQIVSFENGYFQVSRTKDDEYTSRTFNTQQSSWNPSLLPDNISGETYVLSADFKAIDGIALNNNSSVFWRVYYDKNDNFEEINLRIPTDLNSTEWRRCYITYTFGEHTWVSSQLSIALQNADNGVCVRNIMLERATKPSNWTPAPEDMATTYDLVAVGDRVSSAETKIKQTEDKIGLAATKTEVEKTLEGYYTIAQTDSAITAKANEISSTVSSNYATKSALDETNKDVLLLSGDPTNYAKLTESTASQWGFTVEDDVDGDWYVMNTPRRDTCISNEYECNGGEQIKIEYEAISDVRAIMTNGGTDIGYIAVNICLYSKKGTGPHFNWSGINAGKTSNTGESIFGSGVITLPTEARKFQVHIQLAGWGSFSGSFKIRNIKVSRISALDERVVTAESNITQLDNKISSNVTETNGLKSRMSTVEQTASGLTVRLTAAETDVDKAQSTADTANAIANAAKKQKYHESGGESGVTGYVGFCTVTVTSGYVNVPITFNISNRGQQSSNVSFCLNSINDTDPSLRHIQTDGEINVWAYKSDTSKWILVAQKSEGWDVVYVNDYSCPRGGLSVEWTNIQYTSLPTENITGATRLAGKVFKSVIDDAAKTATNYLNFSSSGLVVGNLTASTLTGNVLIDTDSVDIRQGSTVMASYQADKIELGSTSKNNLLIDTDSVDIRQGSTLLASFSADTVILGQNSDTSTISLCGGAGTISALVSEANTGYPKYDAIKIESQELNFNSQRCVATTHGEYILTSTGDYYENDSELYMLSYNGSSGSYARLASINTNTTTGDEYKSGVSTAGLPSLTGTKAYLYANFFDKSANTNAKSNAFYVYPTHSQTSCPIKIQGTEFTGENKVLWSGNYYMSDSQTATLSAAISAQTNGIVLVWSYYTNGAADNSNFQMLYIPKHFVTLHSGRGIAAVLSNASMNIMATKYVYVSNTSISGYAGNDDAATTKDSGVTSTSKSFVLRYVIGV